MISIIIPTYQSPDALDLCLKSALEGQVNHHQIIVVVDGFYDLNKHVLDKYRGKIQVLNIPQNIGLCKGTNWGVTNALGDYILVVNDDNVFPENWDVRLLAAWKEANGDTSKVVLTPNQIEPYPSMFNQFNIKDLGRTIEDFDLDRFWEYENSICEEMITETGSTLPFFMKRLDYLMLGGWDENYDLGLLADWDFFLRCNMAGFKMKRTFNTHFYHFVSLSTNTTEEQKKTRQDTEIRCHEYGMFKWGPSIKHNPANNLKYL